MGKKIIFLFLALLLPGCIFVFLKIFGKNEFNVEPLFQSAKPIVTAPCSDVTVPYKVSGDVLKQVFSFGDSLALIYFDEDTLTTKSFEKLEDKIGDEPVSLKRLNANNVESRALYACVFFMEQKKDLVLVDRAGLIRGQYEFDDLDEIDRLKTEITIILKKY
jgi:hypothetical protein